MRNRLEAMVHYLAGREGEAAPALRRELDDPASEFSRFLEATRQRSRALMEPRPPLEAPARAGVLPGSAPIRPALGRVVTVGALAASILLAGVGALGLGEARLRRLEGTLARREADSRADARRLEVALARALASPARVAAAPVPSIPRPDPAVASALARVETGLGQLERRIEGLDRPAPTPAPPPPGDPPPTVGADPAIVEIRRDLTALRRELVASDQAGARQVMEIRMALQEVGNLLRLSLNRPTMAVPGPEMNPNFPNALPGVNPAQVQALLGSLGNSHHQARLDAVQQLGRMGPAAQGALPNLQQLLHRETDAHVRAAAQAAISSIQHE
jgi:hypothetical protein